MSCVGGVQVQESSRSLRSREEMDASALVARRLAQAARMQQHTRCARKSRRACYSYIQLEMQVGLRCLTSSTSPAAPSTFGPSSRPSPSAFLHLLSLVLPPSSSHLPSLYTHSSTTKDTPIFLKPSPFSTRQNAEPSFKDQLTWKRERAGGRWEEDEHGRVACCVLREGWNVRKHFISL